MINDSYVIIYIYIYIFKLILGTSGRVSTHEWVQLWYLFRNLCTYYQGNR